MDIPALSSVMGQSALSQQVQLSVLKKTMDVAKESSLALIQMMERSVSPHLGGNIDIRI